MQTLNSRQPSSLVIATRGVAHFNDRVANIINTRLSGLYQKVKTLGDKIQDRPLQEIGGKGLFIKELEKSYYKINRYSGTWPQRFTCSNTRKIRTSCFYRAARCFDC